jgi:hypothetical protein
VPVSPSKSGKGVKKYSDTYDWACESELRLTEKGFAKSKSGINKVRVFIDVTPWNLVDRYCTNNSEESVAWVLRLQELFFHPEDGGSRPAPHFLKFRCCHQRPVLTHSPQLITVSMRLYIVTLFYLTPIPILPTRFHVTAGYASVVDIPFCREPGSTHFSSK